MALLEFGSAHLVFSLLFVNLAVVSASTFSQCYTSRVTTSVQSPTTKSQSFTWTWPQYYTWTSTPAYTTTPPAKTVTVTTTTYQTSTTTLSQSTDTVTSTSVVPTTSTVTASTTTITIFAIASTTTTLTSGTTTIPTSSGFAPISSTLPGASNVPAVLKRHRLAARDSPPSLNQQSVATWVKSVVCYKWVIVYTPKTITKTATKTTTKTWPVPTKTQTITKTSTITTTVAQTHASTTITITSTSTGTTTATPTTQTTTTTTSTQTVLLPSSTFYAACDTPNLANTYDGSSIAAFEDLNGNGFSSTGDTAAYDCCVSCINNPFCVTFGYAQRYSPSCYMYTNNVCTAEGQYQDAIEIDPSMDAGYTVGNGNCGFFTSTY